MRDNINKCARFLINWCLKNNVETIILGWNKGQKNGINIGAKNNQKFVQIPTAKLKDRIAQLCLEYGIEFIETEESYTSKSSFLDNDELPKFSGEKPAREYIFSGKRVKRGLYRTKNRFLINADSNGAANIIRKANQNVSIQTSFDLSEVCREVLSLPHLYDIFNNLKKSYRKQASKNVVLTRSRLGESWHLFEGENAFKFVQDLTQFNLKGFLDTHQNTLTNIIHQALAKL